MGVPISGPFWGVSRGLTGPRLPVLVTEVAANPSHPRGDGKRSPHESARGGQGTPGSSAPYSLFVQKGETKNMAVSNEHIIRN